VARTTASPPVGSDPPVTIIPNENDTEVLTSGVTTVSDQSADGKDFILAGMSSSDAPTLQFIGGFATRHSYSPQSLLVAGNGNVDLGFGVIGEITNGMNVLFGQLNWSVPVGSDVTFDGNSSINGGGTLTDAAGLRPNGAGSIENGTFILNGMMTVGSIGSNKLDLANGAALAGNGTIRQTGTNDITSVGNVAAGVHFDIQKGELIIAGQFSDEFNGTIGPANGSGPSLGPSADVVFYPEGNRTPQIAVVRNLQVQTAKFDTSAGLLSPLGANGQDLADLHFSGDASGLNISFTPSTQDSSQDYIPTPDYIPPFVSITDHPGTPSPIPIAFS
jgi:hypothetical protein